MRSKDPAQRLRDILENIDAIASFTAGLDLARFRADRKTVYAVVRALEIVSEASRRIPNEIRERHTELDWPAIAAAGNIYRHEYSAVDEPLVWHTVHHDLPPLRAAVLQELERGR